MSITKEVLKCAASLGGMLVIMYGLGNILALPIANISAKYGQAAANRACGMFVGTAASLIISELLRAWATAYLAAHK